MGRSTGKGVEYNGKGGEGGERFRNRGKKEVHKVFHHTDTTKRRATKQGRKKTMVRDQHEYGRDIDDLMERMERERLRQLADDDLRDHHTRQMVEHEVRELRADSSYSCDEEEEDPNEDITIDGSGQNTTGTKKRGKENKNLKKKSVVSKKKATKEETGRERWERIENKKQEKEVKKGISVGRKLRREGKMKKITSYFKK